MIDGELSDLFFNHEHPARDAEYAKLRVTGGPILLPADVERAAAIADATDFIKSYPKVVAFCGSPTAEELAIDFVNRI